MTDILEELDRWLLESAFERETIKRVTVQSARDEITTLRGKIDHLEWVAMTPSDELHSLLRERDAARDEIAALRERQYTRELELGWRNTVLQARNEALEEAAQAAEACCQEFPACGVAVVVIRALKDKS